MTILEQDAKRWRWLADTTMWTCERNPYSGRTRSYLWATRFASPIHEENGGLAHAIDAAMTGATDSRETNPVDTPALGLSEGLGEWVPAHERVPATGTECVVLLRYSLGRPPFATVDTWDAGGWNDNLESDVIAWIAIPPHPPAEWDQRLP